MSPKQVLVFLLAACFVIPGAFALPSEEPAEPAPPVSKPSGSGSYSVGYTYDAIQTSTKAYSVNVRIYYPGTSSGQDATPDTSDAPYPTIVWLPGFGGHHNHYANMLTPMSSWGFVVMAVAVNWNDWPNSANVSDMEDFLDWLENENVTPASKLYGMVDKENFGLSGHSSGGGLTIADGRYVDRIKAAQPFAAAIAPSSIDGIASGWKKPLLCQVGQDDSNYIEGSRRAFEKIGPPNGLWESIGQGHQGPWQAHVFHAFYLYHLAKQTDYYTYLYGEEAVKDHLANIVDLKFKFDEDIFFPPTVSAEGPPDAFMDEDAQFNGSIEGFYLPDHSQSEFVWDIDYDGFDDYASGTDRNATHAYTDPGTFQISFAYKLGRLTVEIETPLKITIYNIDPMAHAGDDVELDEDEAYMFDGSASTDTPSDVSLLEYMWEFGDKKSTSFDTDPQALHSYDDGGTYTVTLTVRDRHDAIATDELEVTVTNVAPQADAGADITVVEDGMVQFDGTGNDTASDQSLLEFKWSFGDGKETDWSDETTASHTYTSMGVYNAAFSVRDDDDEVTTDTLEVTVSNVDPLGGITSPEEGSEFQEDVEVEFIGWGDDTMSDLYDLEYRWDFGDGTVQDWGMLASAMHTYTESGSYTVKFFVKDNNGMIIEDQVNITVVNIVPTAEIEEPADDMTVEEDTKVTFKGTGTDTESDGLNLTFEWVIAGETKKGEEITYEFNKAGSYNIIFRVTDPDGESDEVTIKITVNNRPPTVTASVTPLQIEPGESISFTATATDTPSDIGSLGIEWNFDDGTTSSDAEGTHTYESEGTFSVVLTVEDDDGAQASKTFKVTVKKAGVTPPPNGGGGGVAGMDSIMLGGIIAVIVVIVIVLLVVMMVMKKKKPAPAFEGPYHPEQETGPPAPAEQAPRPAEPGATEAPPPGETTSPEAEDMPPADADDMPPAEPEEPPAITDIPGGERE
jgi:PKD repeat protein/dienelactone hydrolase